MIGRALKGRVCMFLWMKRIAVVISTSLTMGLLLPPDAIRDVRTEQSLHKLDEYVENPIISKINKADYALYEAVLPVKAEQYIHRHILSKDVINEYIVRQAYKQSMYKFGKEIQQKIEKPFQQKIYPQLQYVLPTITNTLRKEDWAHVKVTSTPAAGKGEKILHVYNEQSNEDIFRFHVRIDRPPHKGYVFNFHYHTYLDNYEKHHELGTIYWGKNRPQQWTKTDRV